MSKDPAILFYTGDFITGTLTMTDDQRGKYILLLCLQHQKGRLTEKDMLKICKTYDEDIFEKFISKDGKFYNDRMEEETLKRKAYSESRRKNRLSSLKKTSKTYDKHMEDINENEDISKDKDESEKSLHSILKEIFLDYYLANKQMEFYWNAKEARSLKNLITKLKHYTDEKKIPDAFRIMLEQNKDKWINDNLSVSIINSKFNEIVSKIKGSVDPRLEEIERKHDELS